MDEKKVGEQKVVIVGLPCNFLSLESKISNYAVLQGFVNSK